MKAIALAALSSIIEGAGYVPYFLVRRGKRHEALIRAQLRIHEHDQTRKGHAHGLRSDMLEGTFTTETRIIRRDELFEEFAPGESSLPENIHQNLYSDRSHVFFIAAYGATRRVESSEFFDRNASKRRRLRYHRVSSLFEDHIALTPLSVWFDKIRGERQGEIVKLINQLLPPDIRFTGKRQYGEYLFRQRRLDIPFPALSDGYRAYIGWICDLIYHPGQSHQVCAKIFNR